MKGFAKQKYNKETSQKNTVTMGATKKCTIDKNVWLNLLLRYKEISAVNKKAGGDHFALQYNSENGNCVNIWLLLSVVTDPLR